MECRINIVCREGAGKMIRGEGKIEFCGGITGKGRRYQNYFLVLEIVFPKVIILDIEGKIRRSKKLLKMLV